MNYFSPGRSDLRSSGFSLLKGCWMLLTLATALGMAYLWLYSQVVDVSRELEKFENELTQLRTRSAALKLQLAKLQTPAVIKSRLKEQRINLVVPQLKQIVRVRQGGVLRPAEAQQQFPPRESVILSKARPSD